MSINQKNILFLIGIGIIFFFPFLGHVHLFDWDEINFAESAREMIESGDFFRVKINYEPFWEKPPFFFWLQVISMKIFGINEFAARFPNALLGIISLLVLYKIGKKLVSEKFGMIWSLVYLASFLPHLYFKSGIIDPFFNSFIFLSIYFLILTLKKPTVRKRNSLAAGIFLGLAIITKGPVALALILLTFIIYIVIRKGKVKIPIMGVVIFFFSSLAITFIWFGYETITNSPWFIIEFVQYQLELLTEPVAGHEQPIYYHFLVVLLGCFPMSILALPAFRKRQQEVPYDFTLWMKILFWVVMILFTIVKTKIVHYSSMSYLPLSFLAAIVLFSYTKEGNYKISKAIKITFLTIGSIFGILLVTTPILFKYNHLITPYIKDKFAVASFNTEMNWQGWEFIIGILFIIGLIISYRFLSKNNITKFLKSIAISTGATLLLYSIFVVPKIEKFSQGPAIEFYESIANEDVYVTTIGFKSYAPYFYTRVKPSEIGSGILNIKVDYKNNLTDQKKYKVTDLNTITNNWLLTGEIDKKAYFVAKITHRDAMSQYKKVNLIKSDGGFDFYSRNP
ncbi:glycosyltransferase family 39 protein [Flavobacteriales bacterium]|nr:glycosyltransferase family 39 protein [Flavobacteriales bacterium]MDB4088329.1 glycosyltransferase family 39 protein [Flavobacteriales bacterium]